MTANTSSDYTDINITVAMITLDSFHQLQVRSVFKKHFSQLITSVLLMAFWQVLAKFVFDCYPVYYYCYCDSILIGYWYVITLIDFDCIRCVVSKGIQCVKNRAPSIPRSSVCPALSWLEAR